MPTPSSGAISMNDMRTHITQGSGAISMSEVRTRYAKSGAISFNELYKCQGCVITAELYTDKSQSFWGYDDVKVTGTITPSTAGGRLQLAANSFLYSARTESTSSVGIFEISHSDTDSFANGDLVTTGYKATNITRAVIGNTNCVIGQTSSNSITSFFIAEFNFRDFSGARHSLLKF